MLAIYHDNTSLFHSIHVLKVEEASSDALDKAIEKEEYPIPTSDIVFIENDIIIDQFHYGEDRKQ